MYRSAVKGHNNGIVDMKSSRVKKASFKHLGRVFPSHRPVEDGTREWSPLKGKHEYHGKAGVLNDQEDTSSSSCFGNGRSQEEDDKAELSLSFTTCSPTMTSAQGTDLSISINHHQYSTSSQTHHINLELTI
ncbi:hypothetical protein HS088_TW18G00022 [Tripterygium wilfordii]|uniref:Uncharacterized protein n=2 Tax=Tripterygium wilfordii TaxID=458696 RepID=A0A7J7CBP2_TRIWF|nr:hypothetical protein HS088_TW18G00022 [Tripterygium wilfordii]